MPVTIERVNKKLTAKHLKNARRLNIVKGFIGFNADQNVFYPDGKALWQVATDNEFGHVNEQGFYVPSRPFLTTTMRKNSVEYGEMMRAVAKKYLKTDESAPLALNNMLKLIKMDVQLEIVEWDNPPNAPMTIQKKGFDNPLIDTKTMMKNVIYWIRGENA